MPAVENIFSAHRTGFYHLRPSGKIVFGKIHFCFGNNKVLFYGEAEYRQAVTFLIVFVDILFFDLFLDPVHGVRPHGDSYGPAVREGAERGAELAVVIEFQRFAAEPAAGDRHYRVGQASVYFGYDDQIAVGIFFDVQYFFSGQGDLYASENASADMAVKFFGFFDFREKLVVRKFDLFCYIAHDFSSLQFY